MLNKHTKVTIYEDPLTEQKPEGKAVLLSKVKDITPELERWNVCFEGEDGGVYQRDILDNKCPLLEECRKCQIESVGKFECHKVCTHNEWFYGK